jgi:hypothetical protein
VAAKAPGFIWSTVWKIPCSMTCYNIGYLGGTNLKAKFAILIRTNNRSTDQSEIQHGNLGNDSALFFSL